MTSFRLFFAVAVVSVSWGCDSGSGAGGDGGPGSQCLVEDLIAQCPPGSSPVLGALAETKCEAAVGGVVLEGNGAASGQCYGTSGCRVVCQFDSPCECGIESITDEGVQCADCTGAASCGNGRCEGGETPENCAIDCGAACEPDERRCDGEVLQECSLQGRWDVLPCPDGDVCSAEDGPAQCVRDPGIIDQDAGVIDSDSGVLDPAERIIPGEGELPEVADLSTGAALGVTERVDYYLDEASYRQASSGAGGGVLFFNSSPDRLVAAGANGVFEMLEDGTVPTLPPPEPVTVEAFCEVYDTCLQGEGCVDWHARSLERGAAILNCEHQLLVDGQCGDFIISQGCGGQGLFYPWAGEPLTLVAPVVAGGRLLTPESGNGGERVLVGDMNTAEVFSHDPIEGYNVGIQSAQRALSFDGKVAAFQARQAETSVLMLWPVEGTDRQPFYSTSGGQLIAVALGPQGKMLATVWASTDDPALDRVVSVWNVETGQRVFSIRPKSQHIRAAIGTTAAHGGGIAFTPDGEHLVVTIEPEHAVEIWHLRRQERIHLLEFDGLSTIYKLAVSPDARTLAVAHLVVMPRAGIPVINIWDMETGQRVDSIRDLPSGQTQRLFFGPQGRRLLIGQLQTLPVVLLKGAP